MPCISGLGAIINLLERNRMVMYHAGALPLRWLADDANLLEALVTRAAALKVEWDKQREREQDKPQAAKSTAPPAIDWSKAPWR